MALNRGDIPNLLLSGLRTEFQNGYNTPMPDIYKQVCMTIDSKKATEVYGWLGSTPKMRQWIGERAPKGMFEHNFSLSNKDFEATIEVDRNAIDDDQYGQIKLRASQLGQEARRYYDEYLATVIEAGGSTACYDGQNFFSTTHSENISGTQSNAPSASSAYAISTAANCLSVLKLVSSAMSLLKDDSAKFAGITLTHVMIPTGLEWVMREAFDPTFRGGGETSATNWAKGRVQIIVNPFLTNAATNANSNVYWLDLSKPVKPFIFQNRKDPEFVSLDKPDNHEVFMRRKLFYGVDARFEMGFGDWRMCYRTTGA